jgi:hypothetical protein
VVPVPAVRAVADVPAAGVIPAAEQVVFDENKGRFGAFCFFAGGTSIIKPH